MNEHELLEQRNRKWRLDGHPVRTLEDAQQFIESVGFCLMYPLKPAVLVPTFIGAWVGSAENLPTWQHAYADPRARDATDLMVRLLRSKAAYETNLFGETNFLVAASVFPYFYGLAGDRNPRQAPRTGARGEYSPLAGHVFEAVQKHGAMSKPQLQERLGGDLSTSAIDRALNELWSKLRITRVDYRSAEGGAFWDVLFRWSPEPVREGMHLSIGEALSALTSKYLDAVVAAEQSEVEEFFSHFVARSKVREAINALLAARELDFVHVGSRAMIQVAPPRVVHPARERSEPIRRRGPRG